MHYIGRIQYWANAILGEYNIGRMQYWANAILGECDSPLQLYAHISVGAYRIRPFTYALSHTPKITLLQHYIITTLHVIFCAYIPKNAIFGNK